MIFANTWFLFLLILVPLMALFMLWRARTRLPLIRRIGDEELIRYLSSQVSPARRFFKAVLWLAALAALIAALARPMWGIDADIVSAQGLTVMVVLDVSTSMNAQDVIPSRLEKAKLDLRDLLQRLAGHEIGLILFANEAFVYFPLTTDVNSAITFLNSVSTESITNQGTAIDRALRLALDSLVERPSAQPMIILVSDGENQQGDALLAARSAFEAGVTIHVLGYGETEGVPIPFRNAQGNIGYKADRSGSLALSRIDETLLSSIAALTGGVYIHGGQASEEIRALADLINGVEGGALQDQVVTRRTERFGIFVALALLALSLEMLIPETRRRTV